MTTIATITDTPEMIEAAARIRDSFRLRFYFLSAAHADHEVQSI
jgi:hypothetical protein